MNSSGLRKPFRLVVLCAALALSVACSVKAEETSVLAPPEHGAYVGVFSAGVEFEEDYFDAYAATAGREPAIVHTFENWAEPVPLEKLRKIAGYGSVALITWEPWFGPAAPAPSLGEILDGRYDTYIRSWAEGLSRLGHTVLLRFAHEMNGDWFPWGGTENGADETGGFGSEIRSDGPERLVATWTYIHDIFEDEGADNVTWVWAPNHNSVPEVPWNEMLEYYPGDHYVDWIGLTVYNVGDASDLLPWAEWRSFREVLTPPYNVVAPLGKPIIIAELGTAEGSGGKATWIRDMGEDIRLHFPEIKAIVWFDQDDRNLGDFRIATSLEARNAWSEIATDQFFSQLPSAAEAGP